MKKLLVICLTLILCASCSTDDGISFKNEALPVENVDMPDEFMLGETYPITVSYLSTSTCHAFREFYYLKENNERIVFPIVYVFNRDDCETLEDNLVEASFNFKVTSNGSYIFKFWQGEGTDGETQYLIIEVPVVE